MKNFLLRLHSNFMIGGFGYNSPFIDKLIYILTFVGFITLGEYIFGYKFLDYILNFLNIFFRSNIADVIFIILMCFIVGGILYSIFFLYALIKTILFKRTID